MVAPVLVQMPVVHEPSLQFLQFAAHLTPFLCEAPRFCALLFGEAPMLGSSLRKAPKTFLGFGSSTCASMELAAPDSESSGTLAGRAPARSGLAPLTLPIWAI